MKTMMRGNDISIAERIVKRLAWILYALARKVDVDFHWFIGTASNQEEFDEEQRRFFAALPTIILPPTPGQSLVDRLGNGGGK